MSRPRYVALLRAITNVPMKPFRRALGELGFTDVESYATSGNLLFNARASDPAALERRIAARVGTAAFVRTRTEMARVVAQDPLGAMIMFLAHPPAAAKRHAFLDLDFQEPHPVLRGRTVYFSFPLLLRGRRTRFDIERALDVQGAPFYPKIDLEQYAELWEGPGWVQFRQVEASSLVEAKGIHVVVGGDQPKQSTAAFRARDSRVRMSPPPTPCWRSSTWRVSTSHRSP